MRSAISAVAPCLLAYPTRITVSPSPPVPAWLLRTGASQGRRSLPGRVPTYSLNSMSGRPYRPSTVPTAEPMTETTKQTLADPGCPDKPVVDEDPVRSDTQRGESSRSAVRSCSSAEHRACPMRSAVLAHLQCWCHPAALRMAVPSRRPSVQPTLDVRLHQSRSDPARAAGHRDTGRPGQHRTQLEV